MEFRGASAYDHPEFLSNYLKRRSRRESPNNAIEKPILDELIGACRNQTILDLGCGDGSFGSELLEQGAKCYVGVEGSTQMAALANGKLSGKSGRVHHATMETFFYPENTFDLVTSRFAIHYVSDLERLFLNVFKTLKENGRFIFSVQHPLITSSFISKQTGERRENWIVDDYFCEGERQEPWIDQVVVKYHRTIEHYFRSLVRSGFSVNDLREGQPAREHFSSEDEFKRRQRIPLVLIFSCIKEIN